MEKSWNGVLAKLTNEDRTFCAVVCLVAVSGTAAIQLTGVNGVTALLRIVFIVCAIISAVLAMFGGSLPYEPPFFKRRWLRHQLKNLEAALHADREWTERHSRDAEWIKSRLKELER